MNCAILIGLFTHLCTGFQMYLSEKVQSKCLQESLGFNFELLKRHAEVKRQCTCNVLFNLYCCEQLSYVLYLRYA